MRAAVQPDGWRAWKPPLVTALPPLTAATFQVNEAEPDALVPSVAVTVTEDAPAVLGVPEIRPEELIDRPAGRPGAESVSGWVVSESLAEVCRDAAAPTLE